MMMDSKIFVGLRSTRKKSVPPSEPAGPKCQWDGCENNGTHRAPVGRDAEGLYLFFCLEHVKEYNKGYNFAADLSQDDIARYQREARTGGRQTWGTVVHQAVGTPMPSTARSGSAKALNARKTATQRETHQTNPQVRRLKALEAKALETLGLAGDASPQEIRSRYKERVKMHHPDTNEGNRTSEDALRASIEAHKVLKMNGFC
jgi:hypothetical protein